MTKQTRSRILVIGGGAGGLAAAAAAGGAGADVTILERSDRVGKKILRTGNGRCNLSNLHISPEAYNRPEFVKPLLEKTGCAELLDFCASIGLWTVSDGEGRVYPRSDTASSVLDVLRLAAAERNAEEQRQAAARAADRAAKGLTEEIPPSQVGTRRYARGRAYDPDRYADEAAQAEADETEETQTAQDN